MRRSVRYNEHRTSWEELNPVVNWKGYLSAIAVVGLFIGCEALVKVLVVCLFN